MVRVRPYQASDGAAFKALNLAWIEQLFAVEPSDLHQLENPQATIIDKGGAVLIAEADGEIVGTAGLVVGHEAGTLELVKMSARADLQGKGIGKALMQACINEARAIGAQRIWLESNRKLDAALALYRKSGFRELGGDELTPSPYGRCDIQMVLEL
ncbi:MAG: GNAT family N-acetyltransferase [Pseudomonadota bacterium]|nr:GNAT family N-acetyltransferase [Pseudomonadota bacterium]